MTKFAKIFTPASFFPLALFVSLIFIALFNSCAKEQVQSDAADPASIQTVDDRAANTITVCHKTGNGQFQALNINPNALQAHLAHGDYLPDADGDGYSAVGACTGSMDDCDDNNPDVHPGADEICYNFIDDDCDGAMDESDPSSDCYCPSINFSDVETVLNTPPFGFYLDTEVENCFSGTFFDKMVWLISGDFGSGVFAGDFNDPVTGEEYGTVSVQTADYYCVFKVGLNMTQAEYDAIYAAVLAAIAAHPETINICDFLLPDDAGSVARAINGKDVFSKEAKTLLSKDLQNLTGRR